MSELIDTGKLRQKAEEAERYLRPSVYINPTTVLALLDEIDRLRIGCPQCDAARRLGGPLIRCAAHVDGGAL